MADEINIGKLVVEIGANVKDLDKRVFEVQTKLDKVGVAGAAATAAMVPGWLKLGAVVAVVYKAVSLFNEEISNINALKRLSDATGESVQSLSTLKYIAEQTNVEFSDLRNALQAYNQTLQEVSQDSTSRASQAINLLGLDIRKAGGEFKTFTEFLPELASSLGRYADGANKAAVGTAILKEGFRNIAPVIALGADGLQKLTDEAHKSGAVVSVEAVRAAQEYSKSLRQLNVALDDVVRSFITNFGPTIAYVAGVVKRFFDSFKDTRAVSEISDEMSRLSLRIEEQKKLVEETARSQSGDGNWLNKTFDVARLKAAQDSLAAMLIEYQNLQKELERKGTIVIDVPLDIRALAPDPGFLRAVREDLESFMDRLQGVPLAMRESFGLGPITAFSESLVGLSTSLGTAFSTGSLDQFIAQLQSLPTIMQQAWSFDFASPFEQAMGRVDAAVRFGIYTEQQADKIKTQLRRHEQQLITDTATMAANAITTLFPKSKAAGIAAAIINTAVGITKAMELPPPFSWIQAGLIAATGAAQIAAIRSTSETGGGGAAPALGGGTAVAPVSTAAAGPPQGQQTIFIEGLNPGGIFSGAALNELIERINAAQRDGSRILFVPGGN